MISKFFIERPVLANVIAILMIVIGAVALAQSAGGAISQRGAADRAGDHASIPAPAREPSSTPSRLPIEQQVNGVEGMIYMQSYASADGSYNLTVTFNIGTDLNFAQVLVQNRVSSALSALPQAVQTQGVVVQKKSTAILQIVTLTSPETRYDSLYLSNYANINLKDELARLPGVGNVVVFGAGQYAMRVWLDPDKLKARALDVQDVIDGASAAESQVTAGQIGMPPAPGECGVPIHFERRRPSRRSEPIRQCHRQDRARPGEITRVRDIGRVELGAQTYGQMFYARRQAGGRRRGLPGARRQRAQRRRRGEEADGRAGARFSAGACLRHSLRYHRLREGLDRRGLQDPVRSRRSSC